MPLGKFILLIFLSILGLVGNGCGLKEQAITVNSGYKVVDDTGFAFYMQQAPQRIVSLTYGTDEILFALVSPKRIVALSRWADDEKITFLKAKEAAQIQGRSSENSESIVVFQPDLIIASTATNPDLVKVLRNIGFKVYVACSPQSLEGMFGKILGIARAVDEEAKAKILIKLMQQRTAVITSKLQSVLQTERKTAIAMSYSGAIGRAGSLLDTIFQQAQLRNVAAEQGLKKGSLPLTKEKIIAANPEIILLPTWSSEAKNSPETYRTEFLNDPALQNLQAIKSNRVYMFPDKYRYVASQHIIESIEELARLAYPELF